MQVGREKDQIRSGSASLRVFAPNSPFEQIAQVLFVTQIFLHFSFDLGLHRLFLPRGKSIGLSPVPPARFPERESGSTTVLLILLLLLILKSEFGSFAIEKEKE